MANSQIQSNRIQQEIKKYFHSLMFSSACLLSLQATAQFEENTTIQNNSPSNSLSSNMNHTTQLNLGQK